MNAPRSFLDGRVVLHAGDCREVLKTLGDCSVDSVVTDPPYHLISIVKRFGGKNAAPAKHGTFRRASAGFMGKQWDGGDIAFDVGLWAEVLRVLKPGGHLLSFSGTRTYHRMACAIEGAGFEVRDQIGWCFGSGFPKSQNVSKAIDKAAGAVREIVGPSARHGGHASKTIKDYERFGDAGDFITRPAMDAARAWQGWGTALKPAWEPICIARKPLSEKTIAANLLRWGTGAINVDGCRVGIDGGTAGAGAGAGAVVYSDGLNGTFGKPVRGLGRWPANVVHDGSEEVLAAFPYRGYTGSNGGVIHFNSRRQSVAYGKRKPHDGISPLDHAGSAARFFYGAKAGSDDRLCGKHPCVKPLDLLQYLVRLVTQKGGLCLDLFAGTGTTGEACFREGMRAILIEREAEYCADVARRMQLCTAGPSERSRESIKASGRVDGAGPLFVWGAGE
ncbi:MAG: DNA-methyltransferase [Methylocella sp.]